MIHPFFARLISPSVTKRMQIFALAALTVFSMAFRVGAAASPQDDYLQIYVMINEGDKLSQGGQNSQAREKYETALTRLEKLKNENPEWEPTIVKYRIKYLSDKLATLKTAKESATPPPAAPAATPAPTNPAPLSEKPEPSAPAPTPAPTKIEAPASPAPVTLSDDPSTLRQRIIQLTGDLESARTELKQAKADLDQALTDKKGLQEKLSSAAPGDANVAALQQENTALRTKLASTEESLKKAAGGDMAGEMTSLRGQVDSLEKKLAEANAKSAELTRANEDYKKQIADLTGKLQMAGTTGKSDSTLAKENAMLRSILDRQLKEQARREAARRLVLDEFKNLAVSTEALKTQMEVLSSPLVSLSAEEEGMLKVSAPSLVAPEPEAPAAATGAAAGTATLSSAAEKPASPESYAEKPRIPEEFKDTAARATSLYTEKKFDEAAAAYQEILNKYPQSIYALSNLGVVRFQQQKYPEAEKALREAIRVAPNDAFSHSVLGIVLVQQEKYDDAIQVLSRAVALDPNDAKTRNYLGISSSRKGLQEAAEQECRKAIELDDSYGDAHFNLAVIYATQTPPAKELAKRHYNRALELGVPKDQELEKLLN